MYSITLLFIIVVILATLFLVLNFILAPHNPYQEKYSIFECGFHSFLGQNRAQFGVKFFIYGYVYLTFDLELVLVYPYSVSVYDNQLYGLLIVIIFAILMGLGFSFEIGKKALSIDSRQSHQGFDNKLSSQSLTIYTLNYANQLADRMVTHPLNQKLSQSNLSSAAYKEFSTTLVKETMNTNR